MYRIETGKFNQLINYITGLITIGLLLMSLMPNELFSLNLPSAWMQTKIICFYIIVNNLRQQGVKLPVSYSLFVFC